MDGMVAEEAVDAAAMSRARRRAAPAQTQHKNDLPQLVQIRHTSTGSLLQQPVPCNPAIAVALRADPASIECRFESHRIDSLPEV